MVQIRKPVERSEHLIDLRTVRTPRGTTPLSAAAMLKKKKELLIREQDAEFRRQQEKELRDAVLRGHYLRRG